MPPLQRVKSGDPLNISASTWNALVEDLTQRLRQKLDIRSEHAEAFRQASYVLVQNESDHYDLTRLHPCVITRVEPLAGSGSFVDAALPFANNDKRAMLFRVSAPDVAELPLGQMLGKVAVPIEPIPARGIGWACVSGLIPCWVRRWSVSDRFADFGRRRRENPSRQEVDYLLASSHAGSVEIVHDFNTDPEGGGAVVGDQNPGNLCIVRLGNAVGPVLVKLSLTDNLSETSGIVDDPEEDDGPARAVRVKWNPDAGLAGDYERQEGEEVLVYGTKGWAGWAVGSAQGTQIGEIIDAYFDFESQRYYAVGCGGVAAVGLLQHNPGLDADVLITTDWHGVGGTTYPDAMLPIGKVLTESGEPPEGEPGTVLNTPAIAWYTKTDGWVAAPYPFGESALGCGLERDGDDKLRVKLADFAGEGLEVVAGEEEGDCQTLAVQADCGIAVGPDGVRIDRDALLAADGGLEAADGTCDVRVKAGCGIVVDADGVGVDPSALAGAESGLQADGDCGIAVKPACGVVVTADGVGFDATAVAGAGLAADGCQLHVDLTIGCGLTGGGSAVAFDAEAVAGDGLVKGDEDCTLNVDPGNGIEIVGGKVAAKIGCGLEFADGEIAVNAEDLAGDGLVTGANCKIDVNAGCHLGIDDSGAVEVTPDTLAGPGLQVVAAEGCDTLGVKTACGLHIVAEGVEVTVSDLAGHGLIVDESGECDKFAIDPSVVPDLSYCCGWLYCGGAWKLVWRGKSAGAFCDMTPTATAQANQLITLCDCEEKPEAPPGDCDGVQFRDTFTGTNGTGIASHTPDIGTGWTSVLGTFQIQSNALSATANGQNLAKSNAICSADYRVEATYTSGVAVPASQGAYLGGRDADDGFQNYVNCGIEGTPGRAVIYEVVSGTATVRASTSFTVADSTAYALKVEYVGSQVDFWVNGTTHLSYGSLTNTTQKKSWAQVYQTTPSVNGKMDNYEITAI